jgi:hypothetical protein
MISSARAGNVRVMLQRLGVPETRIKRNTAHGDNDPISENPMAKKLVSKSFAAFRKRISAWLGSRFNP